MNTILPVENVEFDMYESRKDILYKAFDHMEETGEIHGNDMPYLDCRDDKLFVDGEINKKMVIEFCKYLGVVPSDLHE